jgi:hypothetical protein
MKENLQFTESRNAQSTATAVVCVTNNLKNRQLPHMVTGLQSTSIICWGGSKLLYIRLKMSLYYLLQNSLIMHFQIIIDITMCLLSKKEAMSKAQAISTLCELICHILFSLHKATGKVKAVLSFMALLLLIQWKQKVGIQRHQNDKHSYSAAWCMHTVRHTKT